MNEYSCSKVRLLTFGGNLEHLPDFGSWCLSHVATGSKRVLDTTSADRCSASSGIRQVPVADVPSLITS